MTVVSMFLVAILVFLAGLQLYYVYIIGNILLESGFSDQLMLSKYVGNILINAVYGIIVGILTQISLAIAKL